MSAAPEFGTLVGGPDGCGCCSLEWSRSPVGMCDLEPCWVVWEPTAELGGTRPEAVGLTGRSAKTKIC